MTWNEALDSFPDLFDFRKITINQLGGSLFE